MNLFGVSGDCKYIENYYDMSLVKGLTIAAELPQNYYVSETGDPAEMISGCEVTNRDVRITPSVVKQGEEARNSEYKITITNQNDRGGICLGGGSYMLGSYAMVRAYEYEDCVFEGWYEGDKLVSTERNYRFRVTNNRTLSPRFVGESKYGTNGAFEMKLSAQDGGVIIGQSRIVALDGYPVEIEALPLNGYRFVGWETADNCIIENPLESSTRLLLVDEDVNLVAKFDRIVPIHTTDDGYEMIQDDIEVSYRTETAWHGGYNGAITIRNNTNTELKNWKLSFESENKVTGVWNAELTFIGESQYTVKGYNWNDTIAPGGAITIAFTAIGMRTISPANFKLYVKSATEDYETVEITFVKTNDWGTGCTGEIEVKNTSPKTISGWMLRFECGSQIDNVWNGVISSTEKNNYLISNANYNAVIRSGETIRIGVSLTYNSGQKNEPSSFILLSSH